MLTTPCILQLSAIRIVLTGVTGKLTDSSPAVGNYQAIRCPMCTGRATACGGCTCVCTVCLKDGLECVQDYIIYSKIAVLEGYGEPFLPTG